ncbi:Colanic acid biosynthesis glycosyl transferase WcaL [Pseudoalteromonas luteoviolacea B = ATCC 29581]|nr:Colanic acid biosynthesis glycosyl transferase WcaL [Pseudoalteromonas luteoviolacea B = ATCC 29581]
MIRLAIFADSFPSRSETFVINQVMALIDLGVDVTILSVYRGDMNLLEQRHLKPYQLATRTRYLLEESPKSGALHKLIKRAKQALFAPAPFTLLNTAKRLALPLARLKLLACASALKQQNTRFDWIVCHFGHNGVFAQQLRQLGLLQGNIATIFHGADISAVTPSDAIGKAYRAMLASTELALPISELWAQQVRQLGALEHNIVVQRMGVELKRFEYAFLPHGREPLKVFCAARFSEKKGLLDAIDAIALAAEQVDIHFELGGFGELDTQIKARIEAHQLSNYITLLGPLSSEQVQQKLSQAHVYLLPSITASNGDREGVPVALMEAMASGCVVVSTLHSGIPELIEHNHSGLLAPEKAPQVLAEYLIALAGDDALRLRLATHAREKVTWFSDIDTLNSQLLDELTRRLKGTQ